MTATVSYLHPTRAKPPPDHPLAGYVGAVELCQRSGLTYRQCDFWTSQDLLRSTADRPGSGSPRWYPPGEITVAATALQLIAAGFTLRPAVEHARRVIAGEPVSLADGLVRLAPPETT